MAIKGNSNETAVDISSTFLLRYGWFEAAHKQQLEALGLPQPLWQTLFRKLKSEAFDIGEYVVFEEMGDNSEEKSSHLTERKVCLGVDKLDALSNVFLIDHAWTTTVDQAVEQIDRVPGLLDRMEQLTGIFEPAEKEPFMPDTESVESSIDANYSALMSQTGISEEKARELLRRTRGDIIEAIMAANDEKSGAGGDTNSQNDNIKQQILQQLGGGNGKEENDNTKPLQWRARRYDCSQYSLDSGNDDELDGLDINIPVGPGVSTSDVNCVFGANRIDISVSGKVVVSGKLYSDIDASETTWTILNGILSISLVKKKAEYWPEAIVGEQHINPYVHKKHTLRVVEELWRFFQGYEYMMQGADQSIVKQTNWYIQDEVGISVGHSDSNHNVCCLPFVYLDPQGQITPFNVLWPTKTISKGETLTRDYCLQSIEDLAQRKGYMQAIFPKPVQFALDAYQTILDNWKQTAADAVRADLSSKTTAAAAGISSKKDTAIQIFVSDVSPETKRAIESGANKTILADNIDQADVVFVDEAVPAKESSKMSNQHPLNAIFCSTENTVLAFQRVAGAQDWLCQGFHLKTQISEFIGASLMDASSWWILINDQVVMANIQCPKIITNSWAAAVRHTDVGYTSALRCMPSAISPDRLHVAEIAVLVAPNNGLYIWQKENWIFSHAVKLLDEKPEPYQTLAAGRGLSEEPFAQQLNARYGKEKYTEFTTAMADIASDVVRLMLGIGSGDDKSFGVYSFGFTFCKGETAAQIVPLLHSIKPMLAKTMQERDVELLPETISILLNGVQAQDGTSNWKQYLNDR